MVPVPRLLLALALLSLSPAALHAQESAAPFYAITEALLLDSIPGDHALGTPLPDPAAEHRYVGVRLASQEAFTVLVGDFSLHAPDGTVHPAVGAGPFEIMFTSDVRNMEAPALEMSGASDIWLVFEVPAPQAPLAEYRLVLGDTAPVPLPEPLP